MKCRGFKTKHSLSSPKSAVQVSLLVQKPESHHVWLLEKWKWDCRKLNSLSKGKKKWLKAISVQLSNQCLFSNTFYVCVLFEMD